MSAKVQWYREAWWVMTHFQGKRKRKRVGSTKSAKREAAEIAKKINAAIALGTFSHEERTAEKEVPFDQFAADWLRTEVQLPIDCGVDHLTPNSSGRRKSLGGRMRYPQGTPAQRRRSRQRRNDLLF